MFDAFPFDEWGEDIAEFWTFGGEGSTGTWIMTALGFSVMVIALIGFVVTGEAEARAPGGGAQGVGRARAPGRRGNHRHHVGLGGEEIRDGRQADRLSAVAEGGALARAVHARACRSSASSSS